MHSSHKDWLSFHKWLIYRTSVLLIKNGFWIIERVRLCLHHHHWLYYYRVLFWLRNIYSNRKRPCVWSWIISYNSALDWIYDNSWVYWSVSGWELVERKGHIWLSFAHTLLSSLIMRLAFRKYGFSGFAFIWSIELLIFHNNFD